MLDDGNSIASIAWLAISLIVALMGGVLGALVVSWRRDAQAGPEPKPVLSTQWGQRGRR